jgi:short subunit dehydrogenase-like uncharacterized protein
MGEWMIYGANGYTGRLLVEEAVKRGHHPILGGRNAPAIGALAKRYGLAARSFCLEDARTAASALSGIPLVIHCAGPFSATAAPMLEACLANGTHYLDITGEIDVFAHCHAQHARAQAANVVVLPGAGFDVVPTDCLAALLARELPGARELVLAFEAGGGVSPGTAKTSVEGLAKGGRVRRDGALVDVPLAYKDRTFLRGGQARSAVTIPWGDVYTAYLSTGIPNIEVYLAVPPTTIRRLRRLRALQWLFRFGAVQRFLKRRVEAGVPGPDDATRASTGAHLWGQATHPSGKTVALELDTPNGYDLTVTASLGIAEHVLATRPAGGYYTPSQLMGADYVLGLPGVKLHRT